LAHPVCIILIMRPPSARMHIESCRLHHESIILMRRWHIVWA